MSNRLSRVTLCRFRGGTCPVDVDFDVSKPVAVIFGENGNGKSSIVDAIGFALKGDIGSLTLVSVPGAKTKYLASLGTKSRDMEVRVTAGGQTWTARLNKTEVDVSGPAQRPPVHILRRSQLLRLVTSLPKDRYEVLRGLIAVQNVDSSADELRRATKDARDAVDAASERKAQAEKTLTELWAERGKPRAVTPLAWASAEIAVDSDVTTNSIAAAERLLDSATKWNDASAEVQSAVVEFGDASTLVDNLGAQLKQHQGGHEALLFDVLTAAESVLDSSNASCPVCEQPISAEDVRQRVTERLAAMRVLKQLRAAFSNATLAAERKAAVLSQRRTSLNERLATLQDSVRSVRERFKTLPDATELESDVAVADYVARIEVSRPTIVAALHRDQEHQHQRSVIATNVNAVNETTASLLTLQAKAKRLALMSDVVEATRKQYVNDVLASISGRAAALYARLHPDESIGGVSLVLKEAGVGSLDLDGAFGSERVPPQAYYSESHLDTLGFCVFLATAERDADAIVVLDDLFTSVDDEHLDRIIDLLHDEAKNVGHLVITTHYRAWRDRYRYARGPAGNAQLIELLPWALGHGIRHTKMRLSIDELRSAMESEPVDRIGVSARAGILLEALLDDLTLRYRCRMPRAIETHYSLGELFDGIDSKLLKAMRVKQPSGELALEPLLKPLTSMAFLRNKVGCHFNLEGSNVSDKAVREFGEATLAFAEAIVCVECGELPRRRISGESLQCSCGAIKLVPLVRPGDQVV
jgi:hypothetical protein